MLPSLKQINESGQRVIVAPGDEAFISDAAQIMTLLRRRRTTPVLNGKTYQEESRLCALYAAGELSLTELSLRLGVRREKSKVVLLDWGICWQTKSYASLPHQAEKAA